MNSFVSLTQVQSNKLIITPQHMQSIHILQLSSMELIDYLQEQSEVNPILDIKWRSSENSNKKRSSSHAFPKEHQDDWLFNVGCLAETLETILLNQLEFIDISGIQKKIAHYMAGNLNDDGYLMLDIKEISIHCQTNIDEVQAALHGLQSLDPAGVGARDLKECLQLQISRDPHAAPWSSRIVDDYLMLLGGGKYRRIAEDLAITIEEVRNVHAYIRDLNPRPGLPYSRLSQSYLVPDAVIQKQQNGYLIIMNEIGIPKLSINNYYQQLCNEIEHNEVKQFLRPYLQSANGIFLGLKKRQKTLYRVIQAIVQEQTSFFEHGIADLKPMKLKDIADILQLHESTVSRTVQNKYVHTPHGMFELSFFFATGLSTTDGLAISPETVKARIKLLIQNEDSRKPLSDQQIMERLVEQKIQISRRAVMKYREELQYLSSRLRYSE